MTRQLVSAALRPTLTRRATEFAQRSDRVQEPKQLRNREWRSAVVLLSPWLLGLMFLGVMPIVASAWFSLTDYDLLTSPSFVGADNYVDLANDSRFRTSLTVTVTYVVLTVPAKMLMALAVALLLNRGIRALSLWRMLYYLPSLVGASVAMAIVWRQMFSSNGLVNNLLRWFDVEGRVWISDPDTALYTVILLSVWQFGTPMIIFLAGLRQIPRSVLEAASVDGANAVHRLWYIVLPLLTPIIFLNLTLEIIRSFQAFTPAYIISGGTGGPADSTLFYTLYLYQEGFRNLRMGYASAMAWVLVVLVGAATAINFLLARFWVREDTV